MTATAGYAGLVYASVAGSVWTAVGGVKSCSLDQAYAELDTTPLGGTGDKKRILGLLDKPVSLSVDYDEADAGQVILRASARTGYFIKILPDGTNGISFPMHVVKKGFSQDPNGIVTQAFTLASNGASTSYP